MTSIFLKQNLNVPVNISTAVFGLPRGGNPAWADFVDASVSSPRLLGLDTGLETDEGDYRSISSLD